MRKRLIEKLTRSKQGSLGYTLTELLVVIGIIAIICAIAIPSVIWLSSTLRFKQRNDYAKSIFMAAQQNLSDMRANGQLPVLQSAGGAGFIPAGMAATVEEDLSEYVYTASYSASGANSAAMELILPVGSVDATALEEQIIIEYNPITGNVYSVFYSEENENILTAYAGGSLPRDRSARKDIMLGYYDGTSLSSSQITLDKTQASVELINGEEALIRVSVPMPDDYYGNHNEFLTAMQIDLTITGEQSQLMTYPDGAGGQTNFAGSFPLNMKNAGEQIGTLDVTGKAIVVDYPIDSLLNKMSFANFAAIQDETGAPCSYFDDYRTTTVEGKALTSILDESQFAILPGDNITIQADISFPGSDVLVQVDSGICSGVNPMFDSLVPMGNGKYTLFVSNGRNLQNLNAISPRIAEMVSNVVFKENIDWGTTVSYYNNKGAAGSYANNPAENPARALPYFVPIHNVNLFGTATFVQGQYSTQNSLLSGLTNLVKIVFTEFNERVPTLTDELDTKAARGGNDHAVINGNGHKIYNININAPSYQVPNKNTANEGLFYATKNIYNSSVPQIVDYQFSGLFGYVNTPIDGLTLVNPIVKGAGFTGSGTNADPYNNPATGALLGAGGYGTVITDCGVYVDQYAPGYNAASHSRSTYDSGKLFDADEAQNYGVSGEGAVGGLVGYCKSHLEIKAPGSSDPKHLAFSKCFAAVPVSGNMRGNVMRSSSTDNDIHFGYSNGVGGLIGNSQLTNFYACYASGDVRANYTYVEKTTFGAINNLLGLIGLNAKFDLPYSGRTSMGVGGFVGSSHGTHYTNCFATGDVTGTTAGQSVSASVAGGAGGFVGFMSVDETIRYGHDSTSSAIAQRTVFTNCYSVGATLTNGVTYENFSGGNGRIRGDWDQFKAFDTGDYYLTYAPVYAEKKTAPSYEDVYIYRDSYFLSNYHTAGSNTQANSSNCAGPIDYGYLTDLVNSHTAYSNWTNSRIETVKATKFKVSTGSGLLDFLGSWFGAGRETTYEEAYFENENFGGALEGLYRNAMAAAYPNDVWESATSATTHPFSTAATGAVYPFSKLKGLDYYGDWPTRPSDMGMAYYETYTDGETHYLFDVEHKNDSRLSLKKATDGADIVVKKDGYAILSATESQLTVTVGSKTETLIKQATSLTINNKTYHVFLLTDTLMSETPANGEFFVKVTARHGAGTAYTMYFNPGVAISQANPVNTGNAATSTTAVKPEVPNTINVRSARQFAALSTMDNYISSEYRYVQQLNIDFDQYQWYKDTDTEAVREAKTAEAKKLDSIGTKTKPFNGIYRSASDDQLMQLRGIDLAEDANGIFGVIGNVGSVQRILVKTDEDINTDATGSAAVLVGEQNGELINVEIELGGKISLKATESAGLLCGSSSGKVKDCKVTAKDDVSLNAPTTGAYIGMVQGSAVIRADVKNAKLTVNKVLTLGTEQAANTQKPTERIAGGFLGMANYVTAEKPVVELQAVRVNADYAGGLFGSADNLSLTSADLKMSAMTGGNHGNIAGVIGKGKDSSLISVNAEIGAVTGDKAAGFLGYGENTDVSNSTLVITQSVNGKTSAAGVVTSLGAKSVFDHVSVDLSNDAATSEDSAAVTSEGSAAGYALEVLANAIIEDGVVSLGIIGDTDTEVAAGYACTVSGSVQSSAVRGTGSITGVKAAGFVALLDNKGSVASCAVSPAVEDTAAAYLNNGNQNLKINGTTEAAGFALSVTKDASVNTSHALGTITTGQDGKAAGFVLSNEGSIHLSSANIAVNGGYAFVAVNDGSIARCYGWYTTAENAAVEAEYAADSSGECFSSYFVQLNPQKANAACVTLYQGDGKLTEENLTPNELAVSGITLLNTNGYYWQKPSTGVYKSYRYNAELPNDYLYPMISNHYGDWLTPPQYAYGVAYYEIYDDGTQKLHMVDMSNSKITEEGKLNKAIPAYVTVSGETVTTSDTTVFNADGSISKNGYAIFRMQGTSYLDDLIVTDGLITELNPYVLSVSKDENFVYDFYQIKSVDENGILKIGTTTVSANTSETDTRFADAIAVNGAKISTYYVRTEGQLKNVKNIPAATVSMTHAISVSGYTAGDTIKGFSGKFLNDSKLPLTIGSLKAPMFDGITGSVTLGEVTIDSLESSFIATSSGTVSLGNVIVEKAGTGESTPSETAPSETAPSETGDSTENARVAFGQMLLSAAEEDPAVPGLFGDVTGGIFSTGSIIIDRSVSQVFGAVKGAVSTGAITVTGDTDRIFGDSTAAITVGGELKVNGTAKQVFGTVGAEVKTQAITAGFTDQIFGNSTAKITVGGAMNVTGSGKVFGTVGAEVDTKAITVTGNPTQVFGNATAAITVGGELKVNGTAKQVFGTVGAAVNTQAITAGFTDQVFGESTSAAGTITVTGAMNVTGNGKVFGTVNGAVETKAITVTGNPTQVFGEVKANVNINGELKVTGTAKQVFGAVNGVVTTEAITASIGEGQIFGEITTGSVTVNGAITANGVTTGKVFGAVKAPVTTGAISVTGTEDSVVTQVFGDVTAAVSTGAISVTGDIQQVYGNVSAGLTYTGTAENAIVVTGNVSGKVVGTVSFNTSIPAPIKLGSIAAEAKVIEAVSSGAKVTIGSVDLDGQAVGTLFGSVSGTLNGGSLKVGAVSGNLFAGVSSGSIGGFQITASSMNNSLVGSVTGKVQNLSLTVTELVEGFAGNGLIVGTLGQGQTVENTTVTLTKAATITLGTNPFGGLVGTNSGTIANCSVNADFTVKGSGTMGGLVGTSNGTISFTNKAVNVDIIYVPGTSSNVTIGGLAGSVTGGSITGSDSAVVSGSILRQEPEAAEGQTVTYSTSHVVGGVIGKMTNGTVTNVHADVMVDSGWAGAPNVSSANTFGGYLTNRGPVGMFVGYVATGSLNNCSSQATGNKTFQFLGEAQLGTRALNAGVLVTSKEYPNGFVYDSSLKKYSTADGGEVTLVEHDGSVCNYVNVNLAECYFAINDGQNSVRMEQLYGADEFYYGRDSAVSYSSYKKSDSALTGSFKSDSVTFGNARDKDVYYVKTADGYHKISVSRDTVQDWGFTALYKYTVSWTGHEYTFTDTSFFGTNIKFANMSIAEGFSNHNDAAGVTGVYTLTQPSLNAAQYLLVSGDKAYKGQNSAALQNEFDDHNQALVGMIWNKTELNGITLCAKNDYTGQLLTSDGKPIATYDVGGVSCQIFEVTKTPNAYEVVTFKAVHNTDEYKRQFVSAVSASETTPVAIDGEANESTVPTGEAGGETQENNP